MPKLEQICVHGCCKLEVSVLLGPGVQGLDYCMSAHEVCLHFVASKVMVHSLRV